MLQIKQNGEDYWIARRSAMYTEGYGFQFRCFVFWGATNSYEMWLVYENGTTRHEGFTQGFRPIFILSPYVKIIGGEGTEDVPFEIGL